MGEAPRIRDRDRTEAMILAAAEAQLAEAGFQAFGVNAVARRAGCDKQLIYRYFGGLDGLAAAVGARLGTPQAVPRPQAPAPSYGELTERLLLAFMEQFRADRLAQRIAVWELVEQSLLVRTLSAARADALGRWMAEARRDVSAPPGVDAPALDALLVGGVQQLVLASATLGGFAGLPLSEDRNWIRARLALRALIRGVYRPAFAGTDLVAGT